MPLQRSLLHLPLLAVILGAMIIGILAGLARIGWSVPTVGMERAGMHGPILIAGVFGTLIALERAIAMRNVTGRTWTPADIVPVLGGAGTLVLLASGATVPALLLLSAGAAGLVAIHVEMLRRHPSLDIFTMLLGAGFLLLADVAWLSGRNVALLTPWWIAFLVLTITGERIELARIRYNGARGRSAFGLAVGLYVGALLLMVADATLGARLSGLGSSADRRPGCWRHDVAWVTVRRPGFPRYSAVCLLTGYVWLGVAGLIVVGTPQLWAGLTYDAFLHAVLLGFVFSMSLRARPLHRAGYRRAPRRLHLAGLAAAAAPARLRGDPHRRRPAAGHGAAPGGGPPLRAGHPVYGAVIILGLVRGPTPSCAPARRSQRQREVALVSSGHAPLRRWPRATAAARHRGSA